MKASKLSSVTLLLVVFICSLMITNAQNASASAGFAEAPRLAADETLLLQLYVDKDAYNSGDDIQLSGRLSMNGYGIANVQACPTLKDDTGTELLESCRPHRR